MDGLSLRPKGDQGLVKVTNAEDGTVFLYQGTYYGKGLARRRGVWLLVFLLFFRDQTSRADRCMHMERAIRLFVWTLFPTRVGGSHKSLEAIQGA